MNNLYASLRVRVINNRCVHVKRIITGGGISVSKNEEVLPKDIIGKDIFGRLVYAEVFGVVDFIDFRNGEVLIKILANLVLGVIGSGNQKSGLLQIQKDKTLLLGSKGVEGILVGGVNFLDFEKTRKNDLGFSIVLTEGFGKIHIGGDIKEYLKKYAESYCFIDGDKACVILPSKEEGSILALRKIVLPIKNALSPISLVKNKLIKEGSKVRVVGSSNIGAQGVIIGIDKSETVLESGVSTFLCMVETKTRKLKVPYTNLELI